MIAEIVNVSGVELTLKVSGILTRQEMVAVQKSVGEVIEKQGRARFMVLLEDAKDQR